MANLQLPSLTVAFSKAASTFSLRGNKGIVALIIKDSVHLGANTYTNVDDVPSDFSASNLLQIQDAFLGIGVAPDNIPPTEVIVYVEPSAATDYTEAEAYLEMTDWDYLAIPGIADVDVAGVSTWVKGLRTNLSRTVKAVLPNNAGDSEAVIDFATDDIKVGVNTYAAENYCARIAGILAAEPLTASATYAVLPEVTDVPHLTNTEFNTAIGGGKLVLMNDLGTIRIARAVNSLQTIPANKGDDWKKIKIVDIIDQITRDVKTTYADFVGKLPASYDNKCLLVSAIYTYFKSLEKQDILEAGSTVDIDVAAQKAWLISNSYTTDDGRAPKDMTEAEIRKAPTGDNVFLKASIKIIDAIEDISLAITM